MANETHRFNVGTIQCIVVSDGAGPITPDRATATFPTVPEDELTEALNRHPEKNISARNCLFINTGGQRILVDTGLGPAASGHLLDNLNAVGITPDAVDIVLITHCHGDHIGGLVDTEGQLIFPNARYILGDDEWNYWMDEDTLANMGEDRAANLQANLNPIKDGLTLVAEGAEIAPGVTTVAMYGHTPGHMGLMIESQGGSLLGIVDTAHYLVQMQHPEWSPRFDSQPDISPVTRRAVFERAAQSGTLTLAYHFPTPGLGHIVKAGDTFEWHPIPSSQ